MKRKYNRITVKIGSNVLTRKDGKLDITRMSALVDQIAELRHSGIEVIVVSSGAVASGRGELPVMGKIDTVDARQLFSAVGQAKLMNRYYEFFRDHNISCGQVLTTKESLSTRRSYLNQRNCMRVMLENGVIPIVNENDTISVTELMFTDNDELSGMISAMMESDALIILSNVDGIYNGNPSDPSSEVIREICSGANDCSEYIQDAKSQFGRGGMMTKSRIASKVADEGIEVVIANGKRESILTDIVFKGAKNIVSTLFVASEYKTSGLKKWIAHSDLFAKGIIKVNEGAAQALLGDKASSLLPVGVTNIEGEFEKDDIVKIVAPDGTMIGVGRSSVSSDKARSDAGEKGGKAIVHYDYLYLETHKETV